MANVNFHGYTSGGGAGAVDSVNGKTGAVTLYGSDIAVSTSDSDTIDTELRNINTTLSGLATVATTGNYNDLSNKPSLATVATTGDYTDLSNKPTIPTVDQVYDGTSANAQSGVAVASAITNKVDKTQITNPNLIDNPWFTVNQRGSSSFTGSNSWQYGFVDRWCCRNLTATLNNDNSVTLAFSGSSVQSYLQKLETSLVTFLTGKTCTLSVLYGDNSIYYTTFTFPSETVTIDIDSIHDVALVFISGQGIDIRNNKATAQTITIKAMKLELGSVSTLAMDTVPDYAIELAKCRASKADSSDFYANQGEINVGTPNPNLLDNPWFTINQRGKSSYTTVGLSLDRWTLLHGRVDVNSDGSIAITKSTSDTTACQFQNRIDPLESKMLDGKVCTLSVLLGDDSIVSFSFTYHHSTDVRNCNISINDYWTMDFRNILNDGDSGHLIRLYTATYNQPLTVKAMKLELGPVSTLKYDTAPNYATELLKCQRYFLAIGAKGGTFGTCGMGFGVSTTAARIQIPIPVALRTNPTITSSGNWQLYDGANVIVGTPSFDNTTETILQIAITATSGVTQGKLYALRKANNDTARIFASADL